MDKIKNLLKYTEIRTKVTSVFPFFMTLAFLYANGRQIKPLPSGVFFLAMFFFDLTATTINNYAGMKESGQKLPFSQPAALAVTLSLLTFSVALGLYLVILTDLVVLAAGALCFFFGIIYSWGPIPLSHGPYGEIASGFFYGFAIPFILAYVNAPGDLLSYSLTSQKLSLEISVVPMAGLALLAIVPFCLTANIMLANNICDLASDMEAQRYTLVFYLKNHALRLFAFLYYAAYLSVATMVLAGFLSPLSLLLFLTLPPVRKNIQRFLKKQDKQETFPLSVKNFILIISAHILLIFVSGLLPAWGSR